MNLKENQKLKNYQKDGIKFLANNGTTIPFHSILGDDMGLGKTAQSICAAAHVGAKKILVICPSAVKINWMREFLKWSNYKNIFIAGRQGSVPAKDSIIDTNAEVVILNYDMCIMPKIKRQLCDMQFDVCILDECHYLMNKTSGRTKAILARGGIIWSCKYKWALSGTFMKNRNRDCFPILRALFPHIMGKYRDYRAYAEYFCGGHMGAFGYEDKLSTHTEELGVMLSNVMIRRTRSEVLKELPPLMEQTISLEETPEIKRVLDMENGWSEEDKTAILNFQMMGETASYRKELAMAKLPQVVNYIKDTLNNVDKLTVFAYHRDFIHELGEKLSDYGVEVVMGGLSPEQKQEKVDNFVNNPNSRIFIGQVQAAGTGVDGLQLVCSDVIFAELDWVPGTIDQARARCHRMGQKNSVHIHYLVVDDSLEEKMLLVLTKKRLNIKSVMDQVEKVVETKGENEMSLEEQMSRIADSLDELVKLVKETPATVAVASTVSASAPVKEEPVAEEKSKKASRKSSTKKTNKVEEVVTEVVKEAAKEAQAPQQLDLPFDTDTRGVAGPTVAEGGQGVSEPVVPPTPVAPTQPVAPVKPAKKNVNEAIQECVVAAQLLAEKVTKDVATVYINEVTAQITGMEGARLANCNVDQLAAVLDAINSKINENVGEI